MCLGESPQRYPVVRERSKPSTAQCNCHLYTLFLLAEPQSVSCVRLSKILEELSHDSVNRFLLRAQYTPKDLFDEVKGELNLTGDTTSVDDSVVDKPYEIRAKQHWSDISGLASTSERSRVSI